MSTTLPFLLASHGGFGLNLNPFETNIINLAIVAGQPQVLSLKEMLEHFIDHRREVVTRRCLYELKQAEARAHILQGLLIALDHLDEVIELIQIGRAHV